MPRRVIRVNVDGRKPSKKLATVSTVKRLIRNQQETHHHNEAGTGTECNTTGAFINISDIAQGDNDTDRVGDQICLKSVFGNYSLIAGSSGTLSVVRLIMFQWRMDNGAEAPALNDILFDTTNVPYLSNTVVDCSKFKVLYDKMHYVGPVGGDVNMIARRFSLRNFNKKLQYTAGGTNGKNQIYMLVISNNVSGATCPNFYYHARLTFTDS